MGIYRNADFLGIPNFERLAVALLVLHGLIAYIVGMKKGLAPLISPTTNILILGTMPGERSIALQQYYGNKGNRFWRILFEVFDAPFSDSYADRKMLLEKHGIGLWNVLRSCSREGSADHAIRDEQPNDFEWLHENYPNIRHIFFESKSAERFFLKHCEKKQGISYNVLPSTSGLNAGMTYEEKLEQWKILRTIRGREEN
jgi:hypoxanthine-DNA glycosylase